MATRQLATIVLAVALGGVAFGEGIPVDLHQTLRPADEDVRMIEGEVVSYGPSALVVRSDGGELLTFDLAEVTDVPEPLASGALIRVEFVESASGLSALNVVPAPCGR